MGDWSLKLEKKRYGTVSSKERCKGGSWNLKKKTDLEIRVWNWKKKMDWSLEKNPQNNLTILEQNNLFTCEVFLTQSK